MVDTMEMQGPGLHARDEAPSARRWGELPGRRRGGAGSVSGRASVSGAIPGPLFRDGSCGTRVSRASPKADLSRPGIGVRGRPARTLMLFGEMSVRGAVHRIWD